MTHPSEPPSSSDIALAYQPRRTRGALTSIAWNLVCAAAFLASGMAWQLQHSLRSHLSHASLVVPLYLLIYFAGYALLNLPLDLWFGYLEERYFYLAKDGVRAWGFDAVRGLVQQGILFLAGSCLILLSQFFLPFTWITAWAGMLLVLILLTTWRGYDLLPHKLFQFQAADEALTRRLQALCPHPLPPILLFTHSAHREFNGGLLGLGQAQRLLISKATIDHASDAALRFILLHETGHRRLHHLLLASLVGWAWMLAGLLIAHGFIPAYAFASPLYIAFLAPIFSAWMVATQPILAFVGRQMEFHADDFYLRNGGTPAELATALHELARRNLARIDWESPIQPLPPVSLRIARARAQSPTRKESR